MEEFLSCRERKFVELRQQLDDLGYLQPLPLDALLLVERLVNDLLHTTDRLSHYKEQWQKSQKEYQDFKSRAERYVELYEKIKQECCYLKSKLSSQIEDADKEELRLRQKVFLLEDENSKYRIVNHEYLSKIRNLEKCLSEKNHRISHLQSENLMASKASTGIYKKDKYKKLPKVEIVHPNLLNRKFKDINITTEPKIKEADLINMKSVADARADSLMKELSDMKSRNECLQEKMKSLRNQVIEQEKEIYCLKLKSVTTNSLKFAENEPKMCYKNSFIHSSMANDFSSLEKQNKDLRAQLKEALDKQHEAMEQAVKLADRNKDLEKELHDIDRMALAVESECQVSLKEKGERLSKIQERLESSIVRIHTLEQEILELKHKNADLKQQLDNNNKGKRSSQNNAEVVLEEKKKEVTKLNENVKDLTEKVDHLTHTIRGQKQRILELEGKLLENASAWKKDRGQVSSGRSGDYQERSRASPTESSSSNKAQSTEEARIKFTGAYTSPEAQQRDFSEDLCAAQNDVKRLEEELTALRKQLQVETELHENEKARLEEKIAEADKRLRKLQSEQRELSNGHGSLRSIIHRHESTIARLEESLKNSQSDYQKEKNLNNQLKTLQEQTERALVDAQSKLSQFASEQNVMQERMKGSEENSLKVSKEAKLQKVELNKLRDSLVQLDRDKDSLMIKIDEKTERIVGLENELKAKNSRIAQLEHAVAEMKKKMDVTIDESVLRDHERRNLQQEIDRLQQELSICKSQKENAIRENRRIQDDLASLTNDCRISHRELEESRREVEDLKLQLQGYVDEVRRTEELLARKEEERNDLLEQFRSLSAEASVLESTNHSLESETTDARMQLRLTNERVMDLERQLDDSHSLIRGYEQQISTLTRQVATFEMQFRSFEEQKTRLEADLSASRDLCRKLDGQKEQLTARISSSSSDKASIEKEASKLRKDFEKLQSTIESNNERITMLESKLLRKEKECLEEQMTNEELKQEVSHLKDNVLSLEKKLENEMSEVHKYQKKALEYGSKLGQTEKETDDPVRYGKTVKSRASTFPPKTHSRVPKKQDSKDSAQVIKTCIRTDSKVSVAQENTGRSVAPLEWTPPSSAARSSFTVIHNLPSVHIEYEKFPCTNINSSQGKPRNKCHTSSSAISTGDGQKSSQGSETYRVGEDGASNTNEAAETLSSIPPRLRWHGTLPSGSEISVAVDEKEDEEDLLIRLDSPTNSYFSG
ncbi:centrosomal protein of 135 kDa-like isoform X2 [Ischnura elegans]|uniref:centrosomal protein of 135 kDa-like isoform X2 n=1 Tax=Ischnura elegans TaxID=197161 RepID=UPI001ED8782A|nr:centrosomal protein of 135 kDa-like isoform X2 [Ischnura elegans]